MKIYTLLVVCATLLIGCSGDPPPAGLSQRLIRAVESTAERGEYVDSVSVGSVYSGNRKVGHTRIYGGKKCDVKFTLHSGGCATRMVATFGWHTNDASDLRLVEVKED